MTLFRMFLVVIVPIAFLIGCDGDSNSGQSNEQGMALDTGTRQVRDAGMLGDATRPSQRDAQLSMDASSQDSGPEYTDAGVLALETCEDICGLYDARSLDIWPLRRISNCLEACEDVIDADRSHLGCVYKRHPVKNYTHAECRRSLRLRRGAHDGGCDGAVRVPNMLPNLDTCESACDNFMSADIRQCGRTRNNPETCDEFQFSTCILREQHQRALDYVRLSSIVALRMTLLTAR